MTTNHILTTSLNEIRSFYPCTHGWKTILTARKPASDEDYNIQFPLVDCLKSNSIADVCWLIGKRKKEIQICVRFARMCADSVKHLDNIMSDAAAKAAEAANATYANAANAADAEAIYAAAVAEAAAIYAAEQQQKNKNFLIQCINEYQPEQE